MQAQTFIRNGDRPIAYIFENSDVQPAAMRVEVYIALFGEEMAQHPYERHELSAVGGPRRSGDSPVEGIDEYRREHYVDHYRQQGGNHGFAWIACGAHQVVQSDKHIGYGSGIEDYLHEFLCIDNCFGRRTEKAKYRVKKI